MGKCWSTVGRKFGNDLQVEAAGGDYIEGLKQVGPSCFTGNSLVNPVI
jgi:hypothetical protein